MLHFQARGSFLGTPGTFPAGLCTGNWPQEQLVLSLSQGNSHSIPSPCCSLTREGVRVWEAQPFQIPLGSLGVS